MNLERRDTNSVSNRPQDHIQHQGLYHFTNSVAVIYLKEIVTRYHLENSVTGWHEHKHVLLWAVQRWIVEYAITSQTFSLQL